MTDPILFKIFLSSPGDVPQERDDAQTVIEKINASGEFSRHFILRLFRWDDPAVILPMPVTDTPQKSVDSYMRLPSACDLVVVLFWSRMGSPLVMDAREYLSGTHYEYSEAMQGYQRVRKPTVWLYRCSEDSVVNQRDPKRDEKNEQFDRVEEFFKQFQDSDGRYTGGVNAYKTHPDFKALFEGQLLEYLRHRRDIPIVVEPIRPLDAAKPIFTGAPYRGLSALDEEDAPIFFGRELQRLEVLKRAEGERLLFVLGASGSGKSSLVAAGVLPTLRQRGWQIVRCVPGDDPFLSVALALTPTPRAMGAKLQAYLKEAGDLAQRLQSTPESLVETLERTFPQQRVLLLIDQFEEIFTLADKNPALPADSVARFMAAIRSPSAHITTLLTMRADFYGVALPHFAELKQDAYGLTRPSPFALMEMITRPAELAGLTLDAGLAEQLVTAVGDQSGGLALISYVLEALYLRAQTRGDGRLSRQDYDDELGGVQGAINTLADRAYAELPFADSDRQYALQAVFRDLIALTEEEGQLIPTRRRAPLSAFSPDSNEARLIDAFVAARLLVKEGATVEVAHEAILRQWSVLAQWITTNKSDLALFRQVERDAKVWADRGQDAPLPLHEALITFYKVLPSLGYALATLAEPLKSYAEPEQARLLREIDAIATPHPRRRWIGERLASIGDPRSGIGVDADGLPQIAWLPVQPGGEITIERQAFTVAPFYVAKHLITYAQFQTFLIATDGFGTDRWWDGMPDKYKKKGLRSATAQYDNYPRDSVSWYQSVAFGRWLNYQLRGRALSGIAPSEWIIGETVEIRLPTEWEWQWLAQNGGQARPYPWGEWDRHPRADTTEAGIGDHSMAVGMYPHGAAESDALDIAGNLWEWCLNDYKPIHQISIINNQYKVVRGGSFNDDQHRAAAACRDYFSPFDTSLNIGLRLVVAAPMASLISE